MGEGTWAVDMERGYGIWGGEMEKHHEEAQGRGVRAGDREEEESGDTKRGYREGIWGRI